MKQKLTRNHVTCICFCPRYFSKIAPAWSDKRLTVHCGDAAEFMRNPEIKGKFDVIICDTSDPDGPANSLFGPDFYRNMHDALTVGGVICTQVPRTKHFVNMLPFLERVYTPTD
jgi:spermidine synthase